MTPQELESQRQKDLAVLDTLKRHHSDMSKPHMHHFLTESKTGGTELREWAGRNGFRVSPLQPGEWEGRRYYCFDLVKPTIPTIENISPDTGLMLRLAAEFECTYDGWGCEVIAQ